MAVTLPFGADFRTTSGFGGGGDSNGNIFQSELSTFDGDKGWVASPTDSRDRLSGNDVRIRGFCFDSGNVKRDYKIILPSTGTINVWLASGDPNYSITNQQIEVLDNTTSKLIVSAASIAADNYLDASNTVRTNANWLSNYSTAFASFTVATTTLIIRCGDGTNQWKICHVHVEAPAAGYVPYNPWLQWSPILAQ